MPTYEYQCAACGHKFEEFQTMSAKPIAVCPKCKKKKVQRLISGGSGFIFKGSGFYITDYRSEGYKSDAKKDSAPAATPAATPAKSDSAAATPAPAAKPAPTPAKSEPKASSSAKKK